ncbi:MAG: 30S ribosomal protein S12 methylthiotransferase RimO [Spirochaetaceae bacterium]|jgi:ribosomal protein S12 methylthiotransferase|nr:30S ribosomal protein S12 methylthiotransferase RimO [Spirochaetaceae bacterium]
MQYFLHYLGCFKNDVDAETMMAALDRAHWTRTLDPAAADLIVINSCGFIESAKQESINATIAYRRDYPDKKIILAGCLAQRYGRKLAAALPEADVLFGNRDLSQIPDAARAVSGSVLLPDARLTAETVPGNRPRLSGPGSAYVKISEGCNNRCTFCAIPNIRGPMVSRTIPDILDECRELLAQGVRELCLIGQDIGSYRAGDAELPALLEAISGLSGPFWVRLLYIHPDNMPLDILRILRGDARFLPYFDLPFQHGSSRILRGMNRRGTAESYLALLDRIRAVLPDAVVRSTFLTGFPGETAADFRSLLAFQESAELDWVGCFTYSREEDTPAYRMGSQVSGRLAAQRKGVIEERQIPITEKRLDRFTGGVFDTLIEERLAGGDYRGRLFCHAPEVDGFAVISSSGPLEEGTFVKSRINARTGFDLTGTVLSSD